jgi:preprotein translocase subunit YajC
MGGAPSGSGAASGLGVLIPFLFMFVILYFLLIRPEKKKEKDRKQMIASIKQGDRVLTIGGIYGTVHSIKDDDTVILKIAEGAKVEFTRSSIQLKLP